MTLHFEREARRLAQFTTPARIAALSDDEFEGYASLFGVPDSAGDVVQAGAFANSLTTRGPAKVRMLYQHFAHEPIGVWQAIREDARGLYVRGRLVTDTQRGRECLALLAEGALNGLSIEILDGSGAVVRTAATYPSASLVYTAAQIASDFPSGLPSPFRFAIYQLSSVVGRGSGKTASISFS